MLCWEGRKTALLQLACCRERSLQLRFGLLLFGCLLRRSPIFPLWFQSKITSPRTQLKWQLLLESASKSPVCPKCSASRSAESRGFAVLRTPSVLSSVHKGGLSCQVWRGTHFNKHLLSHKNKTAFIDNSHFELHSSLREDCPALEQEQSVMGNTPSVASSQRGTEGKETEPWDILRK